MQIQDYLERLLEHAGVTDVQLNVEEDDEQMSIQVDVPQDDVGVLIGYHGETIAAFQRILRIVYRDEISKRLVLNINDYREKREEKIADLARNYAEKALETSQEQVLPYLPANERFLVHSLIGDNEDYSTLETASQGQGRDRRLVIKIKE